MAKDSVRLDLEGIVSLDNFIVAMRSFKRFLDAVVSDIAPDAEVRWVVKNLDGGSAHAVLTGVGDPSIVERVVDETRNVAHEVAEGQPLSLSPHVYAELDQLAAIRNGEITMVSFGAEDAYYAIPPDLAELPPMEVVRPVKSTDLGEVTGRVQALFGHIDRKINVYELIDNHRVECTIPVELADQMDQWWQRLVTVTGVVRRDEDGIPQKVTYVSRVDVHPDPAPDDWRAAIGAYRSRPHAPSVDDLIDRFRDE